MKRLSVILLSFFYLAISVGITVNVHYCHDEISAVQIFTDQNGCDCDSNCCNDCCRDESSIILFENKQLSFLDSRIVFESPVTELPTTDESSIEIILEKEERVLFCKQNPPPPDIPIWKINCSPILYS